MVKKVLEVGIDTADVEVLRRGLGALSVPVDRGMGIQVRPSVRLLGQWVGRIRCEGRNGRFTSLHFPQINQSAADPERGGAARGRAAGDGHVLRHGELGLRALRLGLQRRPPGACPLPQRRGHAQGPQRKCMLPSSLHAANDKLASWHLHVCFCWAAMPTFPLRPPPTTITGDVRMGARALRRDAPPHRPAVLLLGVAPRRCIQQPRRAPPGLRGGRRYRRCHRRHRRRAAAVTIHRHDRWHPRHRPGPARGGARRLPHRPRLRLRQPARPCLCHL